VGGKQRALRSIGRAIVRGQLRALEVALCARKDAAKQAAIDPLGVEEINKGAAHTGVGKDGPARVEDDGWHAGRQLGVELALDDASVRYGGKVVAFNPAPRFVLGAHVNLTSLE